LKKSPSSPPFSKGEIEIPLVPLLVKGEMKEGDLKAGIKACHTKKRIVGQPFKVAYEFAGLKICPTKNPPLVPLFQRGK
jgi:hypothetical protein